MEHNPVKHVHFGLISHPAREGWPKHGCFVLHMTNEDVGESIPMFSVEACRDYIKRGLEAEVFSGDRAGELESSATAAGLPDKLTRYDRVAKNFAFKTAYRLISRFSGQMPPEEGSGPARFERCTDGEHCEQENCAEQPFHGVLFPEGLQATYGGIIFSRDAAEKQVTAAFEAGLLTVQEQQKLLQRTEHFSVSGAAKQADRFTSSFKRDDWQDHLDVIFGLRKPEKPARLQHCESCEDYHFYAYDNHELSTIRTAFDARLSIVDALDKGLISEQDAKRLNDSIPDLGLPEGSQEDSIFFDQHEGQPRIYRDGPMTVIEIPLMLRRGTSPDDSRH